jgi:hypothetical protein
MSKSDDTEFKQFHQEIEKRTKDMEELCKKTKGVTHMEDPLQILFDELAEHELSWDEKVLVTAGVSDPMAILDLAEWLANHRGCSKQEMIAEGNRLIKKYQL